MRKVIFDGEYSGSASAEKVTTYVNNNHCPGNRAKYRVDGHKYASDTHNGHSVWIEYFFSLEQLKRCFHHNDYMDAEKFYVRDGRTWVEFNYDYEAEEKALLEKEENNEKLIEKVKAWKADMDKKAEEPAVVETEVVPAEEPAPAETEVATTKYKVDWKVTKNGCYSEIKSVVFKSKDNADNFIAIMKAEGYEIVKWDDESYVGEEPAAAEETTTVADEKKDMRYKNSYREYSYYMEDGCRKMCNNSIEYDWETNSRLEFENMKASFASLSTAMSGASSNSFQVYFREVADDAMAPHPNSACLVVDNYDRELKVWIRSVREVSVEEL